jgi:hypothetical protein
MRNVSDKSFSGNQNTPFMFNKFFPKFVPFMEKCGKNGRARQAKDDNIIRRARTHTLRICNTYPFPTATIVARTRLNVTLYVTLPFKLNIV